MFFAKLFIFINMVFLDMLNEKRFENYLLFPIFATNIFLLWYNLMCFFKSHFSRNLPSQISKAVCYGIFSYASSSRLRKILFNMKHVVLYVGHLYKPFWTKKIWPGWEGGSGKVKIMHCTMGLSIALRIWNIWKCKGLVFAQFWSNIHQSSSNWS